MHLASTMKSFACIALIVGVGACGSVSSNSTPPGDDDDDGMQPDGGGGGACGTAGAACCANDECNAGLSCTTTDQVCRAAELWVAGGTNGNTGMAMVGHGIGTTFSLEPLGTGGPQAIWGTSASDVWVVVQGPDNGSGQTSFARHWNGVAWEAQVDFPNGFIVYGLWGSAPNNYWAVDNAGTAMHFDGTMWSTPQTISAGVVLTGVWGRSATDVWAFGQKTVGHLDGTGTWSATTRTDFTTYGRGTATGRGATSMLVGGAAEGTAEVPGVLRLAGSDFTVETLGDGKDCATTTGVWVGPDDEWALTAAAIQVGACDTHPTVMHHVNGAWTSTGKLPDASSGLQLWGTSNRDLFVAGINTAGAGAVFHYDGTAWTTLYTNAALKFITAAWGTGQPQ